MIPKIEGNTMQKTKTLFRPALATLTLSAVLFAAVPAFAEMVSYHADLKASSEVPPNDSKGTGAAEATYDTTSKKFSWTITYSGLTGPATAAHFHAPAVPTANAPPIITLMGSLESPAKGDATLTDAQVADLQAGRWYFNVHTAANRGGELRGQMAKK
jgi:hypothetical protein